MGEAVGLGVVGKLVVGVVSSMKITSLETEGLVLHSSPSREPVCTLGRTGYFSFSLSWLLFLVSELKFIIGFGFGEFLDFIWGFIFLKMNSSAVPLYWKSALNL